MKRVYNISTLAALVFALTGCVSEQERQANLAQREITQCKSVGFKQGTDAFANCRLQVRLANEHQQNENLRASLSAPMPTGQQGAAPEVAHGVSCTSFKGLGGMETSCR